MKTRGEAGVDFTHQGLGRRPVDATIGDTDAVAEFIFGLGERLAAGPEVTLDHGAHDGAITGGDLRQKCAHHLGLQLGFLGGVVMGAIDQDRLRQSGFSEEGFGLGDVGGGVVGAAGAAAQDDVAVWVTTGINGSGGAVEIDAEKRLGLAGGFDGIDGGLEGAVGAVFKADGHRQA